MTQNTTSKVKKKKTICHAGHPDDPRRMFGEVYKGLGKLPIKRLLPESRTTLCGLERKDPFEFTVSDDWLKEVTCKKCIKTDEYRGKIARVFAERMTGKMRVHSGFGGWG